MIVADSPLLRDAPSNPSDAPRRIPLTRPMLDALRNANLLSAGAGVASVYLTGEQVDFLLGAGLLPEKCELVNGEIWEKMPQNGPHYICIKKIRRQLVALFGDEFVFSQSPIALSTNDNPEPDVFVTAQTERAYLNAKPPAADIRLVIEVSDSTFLFDRDDKGPRYAAAGILEYWQFDVNDRKLYIYRNPAPGGYPQPVTLLDTHTVSCLAAPHTILRVADLLP